MLYHVRGTLAQAQLRAATHAEFLELVRSLVRPTVALLEGFRRDGRVAAGGVVAGTADVLLILDLPDGSPHAAVRHLLTQLPLFGHYTWDVTPLEGFSDWDAS
jgi:muconolactone delta-isomerase